MYARDVVKREHKNTTVLLFCDRLMALFEWVRSRFQVSEDSRLTRADENPYTVAWPVPEDAMVVCPQ